MSRNSKEQSNNTEKISYDETLIENALEIADRDLKTAQALLIEHNFDWAFSIAYNAMLQAGRALMFLDGFRPKGDSKHVSVINFVKKRYKEEFSHEILAMFDKLRKMRHLAVYEAVNTIGENEAQNAVKVAQEFIRRVKEIT